MKALARILTILIYINGHQVYGQVGGFGDPPKTEGASGPGGGGSRDDGGLTPPAFGDGEGLTPGPGGGHEPGLPGGRPPIGGGPAPSFPGDSDSSSASKGVSLAETSNCFPGAEKMDYDSLVSSVQAAQLNDFLGQRKTSGGSYNPTLELELTPYTGGEKIRFPNPTPVFANNSYLSPDKSQPVDEMGFKSTAMYGYDMAKRTLKAANLKRLAECGPVGKGRQMTSDEYKYFNVLASENLNGQSVSDPKSCKFNSYGDYLNSMTPTRKSMHYFLMGFEIVHSGSGGDKHLSGELTTRPNEHFNDAFDDEAFTLDPKKFHGLTIYERGRLLAKEIRKNREYSKKQFASLDKQITQMCESLMNRVSAGSQNENNRITSVEQNELMSTWFEMQSNALAAVLEKETQILEDVQSLANFVKNYPWYHHPATSTFVRLNARDRYPKKEDDYKKNLTDSDDAKDFSRYANTAPLAFDVYASSVGGTKKYRANYRSPIEDFIKEARGDHYINDILVSKENKDLDYGKQHGDRYIYRFPYPFTDTTKITRKSRVRNELESDFCYGFMDIKECIRNLSLVKKSELPLASKEALSAGSFKSDDPIYLLDLPKLLGSDFQPKKLKSDMNTIFGSYIRGAGFNSYPNFNRTNGDPSLEELYRRYDAYEFFASAKKIYNEDILRAGNGSGQDSKCTNGVMCATRTNFMGEMQSVVKNKDKPHHVLTDVQAERNVQTRTVQTVGVGIALTALKVALSFTPFSSIIATIAVVAAIVDTINFQEIPYSHIAKAPIMDSIDMTDQFHALVYAPAGDRGIREFGVDKAKVMASIKKYLKCSKLKSCFSDDSLTEADIGFSDFFGVSDTSSTLSLSLADGSSERNIDQVAEYIYDVHYILPRISAFKGKAAYPTLGMQGYYDFAVRTALASSADLLNLQEAMARLAKAYEAETEKTGNQYEALITKESGSGSRNVTPEQSSVASLDIASFSNQSSLALSSKAFDKMLKQGNFSPAQQSYLRGKRNLAFARANLRSDLQDDVTADLLQLEKEKKGGRSARARGGIRGGLDNRNQGGDSVNPAEATSTTASTIGLNEDAQKALDKKQGFDYQMPSFSSNGGYGSYGSNDSGGSSAPANKLSDAQITHMIQSANKDEDLSQKHFGDTLFDVVTKAYHRNLDRMLILKAEKVAKRQELQKRSPASNSKKAQLRKLLKD